MNPRSKEWRDERKQLLLEGLCRCARCRLVKPTYHFGSKNGAPISYCKPCFAEMTQERMKEKRSNPEFVKAHNEAQVEKYWCREPKKKRKKPKWML